MSWLPEAAGRVTAVAAITAGGHLLYTKLPAVTQSTVLAEFPVVATVLALFVYLSIVHQLLWQVSAIRQRLAGTAH
jgi:hypothetical protein